jgi:AraC-like DNA-binding protein
MLLGYGRLKRWLALLLASSTKDANAKPLLFAAVRRGLLLEELVRHQGDAELRGEMFICGVFSLLDRLLNQPFVELLASVPVPERVRQALASQPLDTHNATDLAGLLNVSARTLHRQLKEEGATLQALKDEVRLQRASELLLRSNRPIKQVAEAAGFLNEKSFFRAFKGWTGVAPGEWRASR